MPAMSCVNAPSTAKLFVQLCARRSASSLTASSGPSLILDILLPPRTQSRALYTTGARNGAFAMRHCRALANASVRRGVIASRRTFTTSRLLAKTMAVFNPQRDEDGNEMILEITPRAASRLSQIMSKDKNPHLALRIQVQSGGCHGFQYVMSLTTLPSLQPDQVAADVTTTSSTPALSEEDVIFSFSPDGSGAPSSADSAKIVLDVPSLELLKGSKVDYTMELIGSQFKIVDNPMATSSCGCGTSFDIKM